ncbi:hypothetical protein BATDEDRAFT_34118 [Batrachochytrium dendrobatidis JAM81]|uniref:Uncharacterized protein n=1 Tax=Batrachochytrium dendrobatidis (strain JAM81 / FGSC 10211) TaxID=684364 RepID=F4NVS7_BATDJ|nr:uncharacterized protein BATDEDRAFT_34118 [Batrachochytrium dendrobatidis JAM81]EGF83322.1 hypothetical protein BATDEDRAFT_34118 [Batrachochytrium dendrobatidis JAM81]|eukprot:XP_006675756.1 hypothetical protein BATDEDRAFT_34118 [Batrachochytrium dendrobatidis JAM81]
MEEPTFNTVRKRPRITSFYPSIDQLCNLPLEPVRTSQSCNASATSATNTNTVIVISDNDSNSSDDNADTILTFHSMAHDSAVSISNSRSLAQPLRIATTQSMSAQPKPRTALTNTRTTQTPATSKNKFLRNNRINSDVIISKTKNSTGALATTTNLVINILSDDEGVLETVNSTAKQLSAPTISDSSQSWSKSKHARSRLADSAEQNLLFHHSLNNSPYTSSDTSQPANLWDASISSYSDQSLSSASQSTTPPETIDLTLDDTIEEILQRAVQAAGQTQAQLSSASSQLFKAPQSILWSTKTEVAADTSKSSSLVVEPTYSPPVCTPAKSSFKLFKFTDSSLSENSFAKSNPAFEPPYNGHRQTPADIQISTSHDNPNLDNSHSNQSLVASLDTTSPITTGALHSSTTVINTSISMLNEKASKFFLDLECQLSSARSDDVCIQAFDDQLEPIQQNASTNFTHQIDSPQEQSLKHDTLSLNTKSALHSINGMLNPDLTTLSDSSKAHTNQTRRRACLIDPKISASHGFSCVVPELYANSNSTIDKSIFCSQSLAQIESCRVFTESVQSINVSTHFELGDSQKIHCGALYTSSKHPYTTSLIYPLGAAFRYHSRKSKPEDQAAVLKSYARVFLQIWWPNASIYAELFYGCGISERDASIPAMLIEKRGRDIRPIMPKRSISALIESQSKVEIVRQMTDSRYRVDGFSHVTSYGKRGEIRSATCSKVIIHNNLAFTSSVETNEIKIWYLSLPKKTPNLNMPRRSSAYVLLPNRFSIDKPYTLECESGFSNISSATKVSEFDFDVASNTLAAGSLDGTVYVWKSPASVVSREHFMLRDMQEIHDQKFRPVLTVKFGSGITQGQLFAGYEQPFKQNDQPGLCHLWDMTSNRTPLRTFTVEKNSTSSIAWCSDRNMLALGVDGSSVLNNDSYGDGDRKVRFFDVRQPHMIGATGIRVVGHEELLFSPCGTYLAISGRSKPMLRAGTRNYALFSIVDVLDVRNLRRPLAKLDHDVAVEYAHVRSKQIKNVYSTHIWTQSGLLITGGSDFASRLWDVKRSDCRLRTIDYHDGTVVHFALSQDDDMLAVGTDTSQITIYSMKGPEKYIQKLQTAYNHGREAVGITYPAL